MKLDWLTPIVTDSCGGTRQVAYRLREAQSWEAHTEEGALRITLHDPSAAANPSARPIAVDASEFDSQFDPRHRRALQVLDECRASATSLYLPDRFEAFGALTLAPGLCPLVLPVLAQTGMLFHEADLEAGPLAWGHDGPLQVRLALTRQRGKSGAIFRPEIEHVSRAPVPPTEICLLSDSDIARVGATLYLLEPRGVGRLLRRFLEQGPVEVSERELPRLIEHVARLPLPEIDCGPGVGWTRADGAPTPRISIQPPRSLTPPTRAWADVRFRYGDVEYALDSEQPGHADRATRSIVRRDRVAERQMRDALLELGFAEPAQINRNDADLQVPRSRLDEALPLLIERGWEVELHGSRLRRPQSHSLSVSSGTDWFDLQATLEFETGSVRIPELLTALERGSATVSLRDGSQGLIPGDWAERLRRLVELGEEQDAAVRFRPQQALLLDALLAQNAETFGDATYTDAGFRRVCERIRRASAPRARSQPRGFRGEMRAYQREALGWMQHLRSLGLGGCLADDMGLGKTVQVLAFLVGLRASRKRSSEHLPSLVVVPRSLVHNWQAEAERFTPQLRLVDYTGPGRVNARERIDACDLVLTTYGTLRRDLAKLRELRFEYVVLDEATAIKNPSSQAWKAARELRAEQRLALTGTPVENHLGELWALFEFLNPGMLGASARSRQLAQQDDGHLRAIRRALEPFMLRRTKQQVLPQLPSKTEQTLYCELTGAQRRQYDELLRYYRGRLRSRIREQGIARSRMHVLEALLRLRQVACHPGLVDTRQADAASAKLDVFLPALEQAVDEGHEVLVFSQFTSFLSIVRQRLDARDVSYAYLDGRTRKRADCVRRFQEDPDCRVFLISLRAGGHGLTLTAADYVFLLDPWWNPAVEAQAIDRAHRIGQTRPVMAYRVVARDTVEEKILALQETKRELADAILSTSRGGLRQLTVDDLEVLLA